MTICPACSAAFIEGSDLCEQCGHALTDMHLSRPSFSPAEGLLVDRVKVVKPAADVVSCPPEMTVKEVLTRLAEARVGCMVIVDEEGQPIGIFSERDALLHFGSDYADYLDRPISDFMTTNPQTLEAKNRLAFAVQRMDLGGFRHVPVVDEENHLSAIISVRDILRYMTDKLVEEESTK